MNYYLNPEFLLNFYTEKNNKHNFAWLLVGNYYGKNEIIKTDLSTKKEITNIKTIGAFTPSKSFPFSFVEKNEETGEGCYIKIERFLESVIVEENQEYGIKLDETYAVLIDFGEEIITDSLQSVEGKRIIFIHKNEYNDSLLNKVNYKKITIGNTKVNLNGLEN